MEVKRGIYPKGTYPVDLDCENCEEYKDDAFIECTTSIFTRDFYEQAVCPLMPNCKKHNSEVCLN